MPWCWDLHSSALSPARQRENAGSVTSGPPPINSMQNSVLKKFLAISSSWSEGDWDGISKQDSPSRKVRPGDLICYGDDDRRSLIKLYLLLYLYLLLIKLYLAKRSEAVLRKNIKSVGLADSLFHWALIRSRQRSSHQLLKSDAFSLISLYLVGINVSTLVRFKCN